MKTLIKLSLYLLAFVPLIVDTRVFYPYTSGKALFIQTFLLLAGILLIINFFYSKSFREEIIEKGVKYIKNPLVLSVLAFIFINIISTIFAVDKYSAFWGDLSRAEGLVGTISFFSFFVFSLLIFEKGDWLWFFKLSLLTSLILLGKEFVEYFGGLSRPGSYTGNPTFLAGYLLFGITSALIVLHSTIPFEIARARSVYLFRMGSIITIILSVIGLFLTQTRGALLGLFLGIFAILIYLTFKGGNITYKKLNLQKISISLLCLGIIFTGIFAITRQNDIWQKVPGLARIAKIGSGDAEDLSTPVRFYLYKSSIKAVNPAQNGFGKFLIGWGPENFALAESQNYDPSLYQHEDTWHDRAHNKFLDVLVMNGLLGLLAYLAIWLMFLISFFKKPARIPVSVDGVGWAINIAFLFFAVAYLSHLFFVFDTINTSLAFFAIFAFVVVSQGEALLDAKKGHALSSKESMEKQEILTGTVLVVLTLFLGYMYYANTLQGYRQMRNYTALIQNAYTDTFESKIDAVFTPFTVTQMNIRRDFLAVTNDLYNKNPDEVRLNFLKKAVVKSEQYVKRRPDDFVFLTTLADFYTRKGNPLKDLEYLKQGEKYFRQILAITPNRPDMNFLLAINLSYQNNFDESLTYFEKAYSLSSYIYSEFENQSEAIYTGLIKYFYEQKDRENFMKVANRLKENNYADSASLDKILDYLNTTNTWPRVNFE